MCCCEPLYRILSPTQPFIKLMHAFGAHNIVAKYHILPIKLKSSPKYTFACRSTHKSVLLISPKSPVNKWQFFINAGMQWNLLVFIFNCVLFPLFLYCVVNSKKMDTRDFNFFVHAFDSNYLLVFRQIQYLGTFQWLTITFQQVTFNIYSYSGSQQIPLQNGAFTKII